MGQDRDLVMSECRNAVANRGVLSVLMSVLRMLQGLPRMLVTGQVVLLP